MLLRRGSHLIRIIALVPAITSTDGCTSPVQPSPAELPDTAATYALHIQASQSVGTTNTAWFPRDGYMMNMEYLLQLTAARKSETNLGASVTNYQYEHFTALRDEMFPATVTLQITRTQNGVSGLLSGSALAAAIDAGRIVSTHSVGFYGTSRAPVILQGAVSTTSQMHGSFEGTIGWTVYRYSLGGKCTASDHSWMLEPAARR